MKGIIHPNLTATPFVVSIPTGQWSGDSGDYYINVTASNVTADSILVPTYDHTSDSFLKGPVWCVSAAGSFTIHTSAIPTGTVTIMVQFVGTLGEAQYQVLADVYSKSQVDSAIAQSTAKVKRISFVPPNDLAANSYGYFSVPAPEDIKNKTYISTSICLGHPASAGGLQLTGTYTGGDYIYLTYYTPRAISKDNSIMLIYIAYYDTL